MKVLIAFDSMKESLSSQECSEAVMQGIADAVNNPSIDVLEISDGGEGLTKVLVNSCLGEMKTVHIHGPLGKIISAEYGIINSKTAVIEAASACGLALLSDLERNPMKTTTFGLGEMILDAYKSGIRDFIIGLGGTSTNDCGIGMLSALGYSFRDAKGNDIIPYGAESLKNVSSISNDNVVSGLAECNFKVACDVINPLCGATGCSYIYSPQKGADENMVKQMDNIIFDYSKKVEIFTNRKCRDYPGAGAAGGLGWAFQSFFDVILTSGIDLVLDILDADEKIKNADIIVTGEGRLDGQSIMGKAPIGVAKRAKKYNKPVIAFCGCASDDATLLNENGIDAFFSIVQGPISLSQALEKKTAFFNLKKTVYQVFRLIRTNYKERDND